ncbi:hypothetical protein JTB14_004117 [Gonioctena quinquepunctata]|nr:hypothetical protein JTB14_004117 [Gonioctena quinquepunctata]
MENPNNSKIIWQKVNEYSNRKVTKVDNNITEILNEHEIEKDLTDIVEVFNKHHATVGSIFLQPVTETEIKNSIHSLENNSSPGFDNITTLALKEIRNFTAKPLCQLINDMFSEGKYPTQFKIAVIKPIFKHGN